MFKNIQFIKSDVDKQYKNGKYVYIFRQTNDKYVQYATYLKQEI